MVFIFRIKWGGLYSIVIVFIFFKADFNKQSVVQAVFLSKEVLMERNSILEGVVVVLVILLIVFLISRNRKDQKKMEQEITKSEIDPEKHDEPHI